MHIINARNVHEALPHAIRLLDTSGVERGSRNGQVKVAPFPVTTTYLQPVERLTFHPDRDVNTAFLVAEALWMLAGRQDVAPLTRYVSGFARYSDDGQVLAGAYGYRWRVAHGRDQLAVIARRLRDDPDDRRCVLQIWDASRDLDSTSLDVPCNDVAVFQRNAVGALDMTVFCRSNDILWGAYFANAFHFSVLQEYMAGWIGCPVGVYHQVSVNWHAYVGTLTPLLGLPGTLAPDPYEAGDAHVEPLWAGCRSVAEVDAQVVALLADADVGLFRPRARPPWFVAAQAVLAAHAAYKEQEDGPYRYEAALAILAVAPDQRNDLVTSMRTWIDRRYGTWLKKQKRMEATA